MGVCACLCVFVHARVCVRGSVSMWRRETTNDVNLVGRGNGVTCVSKRDKGMCSSRIAWVRAGSRLFERHIECVWEKGVRARERDRERKRGGEGSFVCRSGV